MQIIEQAWQVYAAPTNTMLRFIAHGKEMVLHMTGPAADERFAREVGEAFSTLAKAPEGENPRIFGLVGPEGEMKEYSHALQGWKTIPVAPETEDRLNAHARGCTALPVGVFSLQATTDFAHALRNAADALASRQGVDRGR